MENFLANKEAMDKTYLFAYGTLRRNLRLNTNADNDLVFISTGKTKGELYDLGDYPGAVNINDIKTIGGDVFEVLNPKYAFGILDDYEGDEYERRLALVNMESGSQIRAWVYWYNGTPDQKNKIENGDYLAYRKTKDSLR